MSTQTATQIKDGELFALLRPHLQTNLMQRVNAYVVKHKGKKLPEFVNDPTVPEADHLKLIEELIRIVKDGDFTLLPPAPAGQAAGQAAPPSKPVVTNPTPAKPVNPRVDPPAPPPPEADDMPTFEEEDEEAAAAKREMADLEAKMAAAKARAAELAARPKVKTLTAEEVKQIVKEEMQAAGDVRKQLVADMRSIARSELATLLREMAANVENVP